MGAAGAAGNPVNEARQIGRRAFSEGSSFVAKELHLGTHIVYVANETDFSAGPRARLAREAYDDESIAEHGA
jgi:hypothetical protein